MLRPTKVYGMFLDQCGLAPADVTFLENTHGNLIPAKMLGMQTVLADGQAEDPGHNHVDVKVHSLRDLQGKLGTRFAAAKARSTPQTARKSHTRGLNQHAPGNKRL